MEIKTSKVLSTRFLHSSVFVPSRSVDKRLSIFPETRCTNSFVAFGAVSGATAETTAAFTEVNTGSAINKGETSEG